MLRLFAQLERRFGDAEARVHRREVLRGAAALALASMLPHARAVGRSAGRAKGPRVIVLGAGLAGLACADALRRGGADAIVLEARGRVGGRVRSLSGGAGGVPPEATIEAGGEFIGANHPRWIALAERFNLDLHEAAEDDEPSPVVLGTRVLRPAQAAALAEVMDAATQAINRAAAGVDAARPWLSAHADELDRASLRDRVGSLELPAEASAIFTAVMEHDAGVSAERQSDLGFLAMVKGGGLDAFWTESETYRCGGGNDRLATALAAELGTRVRTSTPARAVRRMGEAGWHVETATGETLEADAVVLATPPATWDKMQFDPPLPVALRPQFGPVVKHVAVYRREAWPRGVGREAVSNGVVGATWDPAPRAAGNRAALALFSGGAGAARLRAADADERRRLLDAFLDRAFPGVSQAVNPMLFFDWPGEEHTGMGYSFPAPGEMSVRRTLAEGVAGMHVAGEHCSNAFPGYMEGALETGQAAAERVLQQFQTNTKSPAPSGTGQP